MFLIFLCNYNILCIIIGPPKYNAPLHMSLLINTSERILSRTLDPLQVIYLPKQTPRATKFRIILEEQ